jgi:hypothetical protein
MVNQLAPLGLPGNRRGTAARRSEPERPCRLNGTSPRKPLRLFDDAVMDGFPLGIGVRLRLID